MTTHEVTMSTVPGGWKYTSVNYRLSCTCGWSDLSVVLAGAHDLKIRHLRWHGVDPGKASV